MKRVINTVLKAITTMFCENGLVKNGAKLFGIATVTICCMTIPVYAADLVPNPNPSGNTIEVTGSDTFSKEIPFHNNGNINILNGGTLTTNYDLPLHAHPLINTTSGSTLNIFAGGTLVNNGAVDVYDGATLTNNKGGTINNYLWFTALAGSTTNNYGTINNFNSHPSGWLGDIIIGGSSPDDSKEKAIFNNYGTINNNGYILISYLPTFYDSAFSNYGTLNNYGVMDNDALFNNNSGAVINNISGATINNTGTMNNNVGAIFVNNGTFNTSTAFTNNGIFMGTGTTVGNVVNNGIIAPGNSIGTMTITGNFTSNPGSVYQVETNPNGQSDKLNVSGTATLNGGTVSVLAGSGLYKVGESYKYNILTAGSVLGKFGSVTSDLAFLTPSLSYDPMNVWLTLVRNSTNFCDVANNSNQASLGCTLDDTHTTPDMINVMNALLGLNADQARNAYDQMSGYIHIAMLEATNYSFSRYINTLSRRIEGFGLRGASFADAGNILLASRDDVGSDAGSILVAAVNSMNTEGIGRDVKKVSPWGLWAKGYGNLGDRDGNDLSSRYDYRGGGLVIGFDRKISERFLLGVSAGYSYTRVDMKELSENGNMSGYQGSAYSAYNAGSLYVNGLVAYGYNRYDTSRHISFGYGSGNISRTANATYAGNSLSGYLETGYRLPIDSVSLVPMASLQAGSLWRSSFTETDAGALNLGVENEYATSIIGSLGFKLQREFKMQNSTITPALRVRWLHEFANNEYSMNAVFASDPVSTFNIKGEGAKRDSGVVGFGLAWEIGRNLGLAMTYDVNISGDHTDHSGMIGMRYRW